MTIALISKDELQEQGVCMQRARDKLKYRVEETCALKGAVEMFAEEEAHTHPYDEDEKRRLLRDIVRTRWEWEQVRQEFLDQE